METQVIEKRDEKDLIQYLLKDVEDENENDYPEFDDWASWM
jgi:hypothetical protein